MIDHISAIRLVIRTTILYVLAVCFMHDTAQAQACPLDTFIPPDTILITRALGDCDVTTREVLQELGLDSCQDLQLIPSGPYAVPETRSLVLFDRSTDSIYAPMVLSTNVVDIEAISGISIDDDGVTIVDIPLAAGECEASLDLLFDQLGVEDDPLIRSRILLLEGAQRITTFEIGVPQVIDQITCDGFVFYEDLVITLEPSASPFAGILTFDIGLTTCEVSISDVLTRLGYDLDSCGVDAFSFSDMGPWGYGQSFVESIMLGEYTILTDAVIDVIPSGCNTANIDFMMLDNGQCALNEQDILDTLGLADLACGTDGIELFPEGPYESSPATIERISINGTDVCNTPFNVFFVQDAISDEEEVLFCHEDLNIAMGPSCEVDLTADIILVNPENYCYLNYIIDLVSVDDPNTIIDSGFEVTVTTPGRYSLTIANPNTGNSCWAEFRVDDKFIEDYRCVPDTVGCYSSLDLVPDDTIGGGPSFPDLGDGVLFSPTSTPRLFDVSMATICDVAFASYEDDLIEDCTIDGFNQVISRLWTFEDNFGNQDTSVQMIYVRNSSLDMINPLPFVQANCLEDFEVLDASGHPRPEDIGFPTILDSIDAGICGTLKTNYSDTEFPLCGNGIRIVRNWVIIDWCSDDVRQMIQTIRIEDEEAPEIIIPLEDIEIDSDPFICGGTSIDLPLPNFTDCNVDEVIVEIIYETYDEAGQLVRRNNGSSLFIDEILTVDVVSTFEVEYVLTDPCGNVSRDTLQLTISDNEPPVAVCDDFTIISVGGNGVSLVRAETFDDLSVDNCGIASFDVRKLEGECFVEEEYTSDIRFCCEEVGDTILVEFRVTDLAGNYNICQVQVHVQDKFRPIITCPDDVTIDCGDDIIDMDVMGSPEVRDNCSEVTVTFEDDDQRNQCNQGIVERTWSVEDRGGFIISCVQTITVEEDQPFTLVDSLWPQDTTIMGCDASLDPEFTGQPILQFVQGCAMVDATYEDLFFFDVENACVKVLRQWTVIDWCQRNATNDGIWEHDQIIKLESGIGPVFDNSDIDSSFCITSVACSSDISIEGTAVDGDACTPVDDLVWSYQVLSSEGDLQAQGATRSVNTSLDLGSYTLFFQVTDGCDNTSMDTILFDVVDCVSPSISCPAVQPSLVLDADGFSILRVSDVVDITATDNCDQPNDIIFSFADDRQLDSLVFTCADVTQTPSDKFIKIYAADLSGNVDSCDLLLEINDNSDQVCGGNQGDTVQIAGFLTTTNLQSLAGVTVTLDDGTTERVLVTGSDGSYSFDDLQVGASYDVTFERDIDHIDGITTTDLVLIQRHILGLRSFESAYQVIAADADNNQRVSVADLVHLRRLILGLQETFTVGGQKSWRFVDASQTFESVGSPWPFVESVVFEFLDASSLELDFMGIKIGDVNNSNTISSALKSLSRSTVPIKIEREEGLVHFISTAEEELSGLQLSISGIEDVAIESGLLDIEFFSHTNDELLISWSDDVDYTYVNTGDVLFSLNLSDALSLASLSASLSHTKSEWITDQLEVNSISLIAEESTGNLISVESYPNPMTDFAQIEIQTFAKSYADMQIVDLSGKIFHKETRALQKGLNSLTLYPEEIGMTPGIYLLQVQIGEEMQVHKLIYSR